MINPKSHHRNISEPLGKRMHYKSIRGWVGPHQLNNYMADNRSILNGPKESYEDKITRQMKPAAETHL